uniref:(northern house mosquito) hypothetical protein n=1 Tax=Culex pipiens TaxID=7175 RepID=A0A8D8ADE9_CULPI
MCVSFLSLFLSLSLSLGNPGNDNRDVPIGVVQLVAFVRDGDVAQRFVVLERVDGGALDKDQIALLGGPLAGAVDDGTVLAGLVPGVRREHDRNVDVADEPTERG